MNPLVRTARVTGAWYLGLAVTGLIGTLVIHPRLYDVPDGPALLASLTGNLTLARLDVAVQLLVVLTQALAAVWFYRLFHRVDHASAAAIAAFGLVNATAILVGAAALGTALDVATHPIGDAAATVQLLDLVRANLWGAASVFFGLWLIPMGRCVLRSGWMPRPLGWLLVVGGVGYVAAALATYLVPGALANLLTLPATAGELWIVGYLLVRGVNPRAVDRESAPTALPALA